MDWESHTFWMIDDGYTNPAAAYTEYNGDTGYIILAFTDRAAARRYAYLNIPKFDESRVRELSRKVVGDRLLQVDLLRYVRSYNPDNYTYPLLGMIIDAGTLNQIVTVNELITHGMINRQEEPVEAIDELLGDFE